MPVESQSAQSANTGSGAVPSVEARVGRDAAARLDDLADDLLRCALRTDGRGGATNGQVREAIRRTCSVAHECGLHIEELLVIVKTRWRNLPDARRVASNVGEALVASVVTSCISAYYDQQDER